MNNETKSPGNPINNPRDRCGVDNMVDLCNSFVDGKNATYISAPITTGSRFIKWYKEKGLKLDAESPQYKDEHFRNVIQPNYEDVKNKITGLRKKVNNVLIDPTPFNWPEWIQDDYHYFWGKVIERHVKTIIFFEGWQYSEGCVFEFFTGNRFGIETITEDWLKLDIETGLKLIEEAIKEFKKNSIPSIYHEKIADELRVDIEKKNEREIEVKSHFNVNIKSVPGSSAPEDLKDSVLDKLAMIGNVAQFVSFGPEIILPQRFSRIVGFEPNFHFSSPEKAIASILENSSEGAVNIRSFLPGGPKGESLHYGLRRVDSIMDILRKKASENKYTIVNETIDINDGGVSGVVIGQIMEFSPGDTPKCVDKPGICRLPRDIGLRILENVYGFRPTLNFPSSHRVEFSIHPKRRGIRHNHTILWELEEVNVPDTVPDIKWPNNFSRMLGDKVYGLLIADAIGLPVPMTTVITRNIAPFTFGRKTGTSEVWMRTCPEKFKPGQYPTYFGWRDPFKLIAEEELRFKDDPNFVNISSVVAQESVNAVFSGSLLPTHSNASEPKIEGVPGHGDKFMTGLIAPEVIPGEVEEAVKKLYNIAFKQLGPIDMEWSFDGKRVWVLQLHINEVTSDGDIIYHGEPETFIRFEVKKGLKALRKLIENSYGNSIGIILIGDIGITGHFGGLLRDAKIPSRIEK